MNQAIDPVCGMSVDLETARQKLEYQGTTYYFCAPGCKKAFEREPEKYLPVNQSESVTQTQE